MIVGRRSEQERLDALLDQARDGTAGTLLLTGEPGIGKSALLSYATSRATGMQVLSATGFQTEADLVFAGLADLLRPVRHLLSGIPAPQAAALASALRIGPAVPGDRFTVYAGLLSLLAAAAERGPLLVAIDDAHWLDLGSQEALLFAARRLQAESIAMVVAVREGAASAFLPVSLPCLPVVGLAAGPSRQLLGDRLPPGVAAELTAASGGNPLALLEIPGLLSPAQLQGLERLGDPLPVGPLVSRAFTQRLVELSARTRVAMLVAAASDTGDLREIVPALIAVATTLTDLEPAEAAGMLAIAGDQLRYCHPLLRSTVYATATPAQRRSAHAALASSMSGVGHTHRRAWHLAEAAPGPDEAVALVLEQTALNARELGGPAAAATALERAARLSVDSDSGTRRLREAAGDWLLVGRGDHAAALVNQALRAGPGELERGRLVHAQGSLACWSGRTREAARLLETQARRLLPADPKAAVLLLAQAMMPLVMDGQLGVALPLAIEVRELATSLGADVLAEVGGAVVATLVLTGRAAEVRSLVDAMEQEHLRADPLVSGRLPAGGVATVLLWMEEFDRAGVLFERYVAAARAASAPALLPYQLALLGQLRRRTGDWVAASAMGHEAVTLADQVGQPGDRAVCGVTLAQLEAAKGDGAACIARVETIFAMLETMQFGSVRAYGLAALGHLALGNGSVEEATRHLEQAQRLAELHGIEEPGVLEWAPDLVEAYARSGRLEAAERVLDVLERRAEQAERVGVLGAVARGRGMLASGREYEEWFQGALAWHSKLAMPFERARTELAFGERLRRDRRLSEAREQLTAGLATL